MRKLALLLLGVVWSCTDPVPFELQPIGAQVATVGEEFQLELELVDLGGVIPTFSISSATLPDLMSRPNRPSFAVFGSGGAYVRWIPVVSDTGVHEMTITASDGDYSTSQQFELRITSGNAAPVFLRPLGAGLTLDLSRENCFGFTVEVQDTDTVSGTIQLASPVVDGYELVRTGDWSAEFEWCPSAAQIAARTRYDLNLLADDNDGHTTTKAFSLLLRDTIGDNCEGRAPRIEHMPPQSASANTSIELTVRVLDDIGLGSDPIIYYREQVTPPADPRALETFSNTPMSLRSGDAQDGLYLATVPLTFLSSTATVVEYFIEATDNDDMFGNCDHRVSLPASGVIEVPIIRTPVTPTVPVCERCTSDQECLSGFCASLNGDTPVCLSPCGGQAPDPCTLNPKGGCCNDMLWTCQTGTYQQQRCDGPCGWSEDEAAYSCRPTHPSDPSGQFDNLCSMNSMCESGFQCSSTPVAGASGRVEQACIPLSGTCAGLCEDDRYEPNDAPVDASQLAMPPISLDNLKICGAENSSSNDYFSVTLETSGYLTARAQFAHEDGDLDLSIEDNQTEIVGLSLSTTDNEEVSSCVPAGVYNVNAFSFLPLVDINYQLDVTFSPSSCCEPDIYEPNDTVDTAPVLSFDISNQLLRICKDDIDIYLVDLNQGDLLVVDLAFDQLTFDEDLDVFIHDMSNTRLTPCCDLENGQSVTSDEHLEFSVPMTGRYAIVVEGYSNSQNQYMMGVEIQ
ncbi:MAG: hypothetical protein ACPGQS_13475 [Bradymonadia bacterium]